jgi:hypothetical protein
MKVYVIQYRGLDWANQDWIWHLTFVLNVLQFGVIDTTFSACLSFNYTTRITSGLCLLVKVKISRYRPGVTQRVARGIALLFHYRGTRRGWVVSSTPRPHFTPGKDPVPIVQEAGWASGPVWTCGKSRPHQDSIPDRSAHSSVAIPTELPGPHC